MASQEAPSADLGVTPSSPRLQSSVGATQSSPSRSQCKDGSASSSDAAHPHSDPVSRSNPRLDELARRRALLEARLAGLQAERASLAAKAISSSDSAPGGRPSADETTAQALAAAQIIIRRHISQLKRYNEIKDIGQGIMGMIADNRGVQVAKVMDEFGVTERD